MMRGVCFLRRELCAFAVVKPMWDSRQKRRDWTLYNSPRTANEQILCLAQQDG